MKLIDVGEQERKEWKEKYINRLMERGLSSEEAHDVFIACMLEVNYEDNPVDEADTEISYWTED